MTDGERASDILKGMEGSASPIGGLIDSPPKIAPLIVPIGERRKRSTLD